MKEQMFGFECSIRRLVTVYRKDETKRSGPPPPARTLDAREPRKRFVPILSVKTRKDFAGVLFLKIR